MPIFLGCWLSEEILIEIIERNNTHCKLATLSRRQTPMLPGRRYRSMSPAGRQSLHWKILASAHHLITPHCSGMHFYCCIVNMWLRLITRSSFIRCQEAFAKIKEGWGIGLYPLLQRRTSASRTKEFGALCRFTQYPKIQLKRISSPTRAKTSDPWIASIAGGGESGGKVRADVVSHRWRLVALIEYLATLAPSWRDQESSRQAFPSTGLGDINAGFDWSAALYPTSSQC